VVTVTKEFTYSSSEQQLEDIPEGGNTVLDENVCIRKIILQRTLEISQI